MFLGLNSLRQFVGAASMSMACWQRPCRNPPRLAYFRSEPHCWLAERGARRSSSPLIEPSEEELGLSKDLFPPGQLARELSLKR
jgi:hypothetical protein